VKVSEALIKRIVKQDRKAQLELYRICFSTLMSVAFRYKKNEEDAAALANEAFLKILTNIAKYNSISPFEAWIRRIAINTAIDDYRKNKKREEMFEAEELNNMLLELPKATRIVFNLFALDGYSHKEISEELGIRLETTKWHMKEARKRLKALLIKREELNGVKK
jgi:DNA-directed RNA polymerase specialized sigma24 family protein